MMDPPESEEVDILALSQDFLFSILREEFSLSSLSVMFSAELPSSCSVLQHYPL